MPVQREEPVAWIEALRAARRDAQLWWLRGRKGAALHRFADVEPGCDDSMDFDEWVARLRAAIPRLIGERHAAVERGGWLNEGAAVPASGRLLIYSMSATVIDGLSAGETDGLLDVFDCPAVEFWIGYFSASAGEYGWGGDLLIAWIPDEHTEAFSCAINVNVTSCIMWAADEEVKETPVGRWLASV